MAHIRWKITITISILVGIILTSYSTQRLFILRGCEAQGFRQILDIGCAALSCGLLSAILTSLLLSGVLFLPNIIRSKKTSPGLKVLGTSVVLSMMFVFCIFVLSAIIGYVGYLIFC